MRCFSLVCFRSAPDHFWCTLSTVLSCWSFRAGDMEGITIATFFQQAVNRLRVWKGLPEHMFSQALQDRSLEACTRASREDSIPKTEVARYGFRQNVSRINYHMPQSSRSFRNDLLDAWIKQSPKICSAVLEYSFSGVAVVIKGTNVYIGLSLAKCFSNPFMRNLNSKSILKRPRLEKPVHHDSNFSSEDLRQIEDSTFVDLNIVLKSYGCNLNFDDHLQRLAKYYSREARDFGVMKLGNCTMARTVFELDINEAWFHDVVNLVTQEILKRLRIENNCREAWGGIGVVQSECSLWVSVVCYYQGLYL